MEQSNPSLTSSFCATDSCSCLESLTTDFDGYIFLLLRDDPRRAVGLASVQPDMTVADLKGYLCVEFDIPPDYLQLIDLNGNPLAADLLLTQSRLPENTVQIVCRSTDISKIDMARFQSQTMDSDEEDNPSVELPLSHSLVEEKPRSSPLSASHQTSGSFFDVRCFKPHGTPSGGSGLLFEFTRLLRNGNIEAIARTSEDIPLNCLLSSIPFLCGIDHPAIIDFLSRAAQKSAIFANRLWLFVNERPAFSHLFPLIATLPIPECFTIFSTNNNFQKGQVIPVTCFHPFSYEPITKIHIDHIFSSLARPMIVSFPGSSTPGNSTLSIVAAESLCRILVKRNEDIYHESAIQLLFKCMNELWTDKLPLPLRPFVCSFREVPASPRLGFLQIIEGCKDLEEVERGYFTLIDPDFKENFIRTTCGWCLAAYLLGLSDRHRENTLVRLSDASAIPIDFGFMLGNTAPSINTYMITISSQMYRYLLENNAWPSFVVMFLSGFMCIRAYSEIFLSLATHLFKGHRDPEFVRRFISNRLLLHLENGEHALQRIINRLRHAPVCSDTRRKIEGHQKNKQFLAKHAGNFVVRFVVKRALEAAPKIETSSGSHRERVPLVLPKPSEFPASTPPKLLEYFKTAAALQDPDNSPKISQLFDIGSGYFFRERDTTPNPPDPESVPQFLDAHESGTPESRSGISKTESKLHLRTFFQ